MSLMQAIPMAYYQMNLDMIYIFMLPLMVIGIFCAGVVPGMTAKYGEHKAFWLSNYYLFSANLIFIGVPFSRWCFFGTLYAWTVINPGYEGLTTAMTTKFL